jgi:hypothetical protein
VEPGRDLKDKKSLPSLEILIRLLKSNNGGESVPCPPRIAIPADSLAVRVGPRVAACDALSNLVLNYPSCRDTLRGLGM